MAGFFYLSGLFSARSARRKSWGAFAWDKIFRLGIPAVGYTVVGDAVGTMMVRWWEGAQGVGWGDWMVLWGGIRGIRGPVWYCATLLVFDLLYLPAQKIFAVLPKTSFFRTRRTEDNVVLLLMLDAGACFLVRIVYPIGTAFVPLFLQMGFAPQYLAAYLCGRASTMPVPSFISKAPAMGLLKASAFSIITLALIVYVVGPNAINTIWGGWNLCAFLYAMWNEVCGYLLGTAMLAVFEKYARGSWGSLARYSYPAFLVHPIVVVAFQLVVDGWETNPLIKTAVVGGISVMGSWCMGWVLVQIPGIWRIC